MEFKRVNEEQADGVGDKNEKCDFLQQYIP